MPLSTNLDKLNTLLGFCLNMDKVMFNIGKCLNLVWYVDQQKILQLLIGEADR